MVSNSESFFYNALEIKTEHARQAVQLCVSTFLSQSPNNRKTAAQSALSIVGGIIEMLHPEDRPQWLNRLHHALSIIMNDPNNKEGLKNIQLIANELQKNLNEHKWRLADKNVGAGFDFDSLYNKYKAENRIPDLFDEIISALSKILSSGAIDSLRVLNELENIIATLSNAKDGSYFATRNAWSFVVSWLGNTGWEIIGDIPGLGAVTRGLKKTLDDMNLGMMNLHDQIYTDLNNQLFDNFPRIDYKPNELSALEYHEKKEEKK